MPGLVLATVGLALLNQPREDRNAVGPAAAMPVVRDVRGDIATLLGQGPLLVPSVVGFDAFAPAVMDELDRQDPFVIDTDLLERANSAPIDVLTATTPGPSFR